MKKTSIKTIHDAEEERQNIISTEVADQNLVRLIEVLENSLTPTQIKVVKEIGYSIGKVGASLVDSCLLARITKAELDTWTQQVPEIHTYLELKRTEYKFKLLEIVSGQAMENKDVKLATQLLELQFAEEFNPSVKREMAKLSRNSDEDIMDTAIAIVRQGAAHSVPVNPGAGNPSKEDESDAYKDIKEVLK